MSWSGRVICQGCGFMWVDTADLPAGSKRPSPCFECPQCGHRVGKPADEKEPEDDGTD